MNKDDFEPTNGFNVKQRIEALHKLAMVILAERNETMKDIEVKYADIKAEQEQKLAREVKAMEKADSAFIERYTAESWRLFQEHFQVFRGIEKIGFNESFTDPLTRHKSPTLINWLIAEMSGLPNPDAVNDPKKFVKKLFETHDNQKLTYHFDRAEVDADYERSSNRWFSVAVTLRRK